MSFLCIWWHMSRLNNFPRFPFAKWSTVCFATSVPSFENASPELFSVAASPVKSMFSEFISSSFPCFQHTAWIDLGVHVGRDCGDICEVSERHFWFHWSHTRSYLQALVQLLHPKPRLLHAESRWTHSHFQLPTQCCSGHCACAATASPNQIVHHSHRLLHLKLGFLILPVRNHLLSPKLGLCSLCGFSHSRLVTRFLLVTYCSNLKTSAFASPNCDYFNCAQQASCKPLSFSIGGTVECRDSDISHGFCTTLVPTCCWCPSVWMHGWDGSVSIFPHPVVG